MAGRAALIGTAGLMVLASWSLPAQERPGAPKGPLNTLADVGKALRTCWRWPPLSEIRNGMDLTIRLSFKRNGEIFGARITYQTHDVSMDEQSLYYGALIEALKRCSPLPVSASLGEAIEGRPLTFRFHDTRKQGKA